MRFLLKTVVITVAAIMENVKKLQPLAGFVIVETDFLVNNVIQRSLIANQTLVIEVNAW